MDNNYPISDRIELVAAHLRLIADLMINNSLDEVDRAAFALVMEDLADQLEKATREAAVAILGEYGPGKERQP